MTTPLRPISKPLQRLHAELLQHLAQLDRMGEHVAAAHLAAAIDALEDRLTLPATGRDPARTRGPLDTMAKGLSEHMGERASHVVRDQMAGSTGETLLTWAAIANRIDQIKGEQETDS